MYAHEHTYKMAANNFRQTTQPKLLKPELLSDFWVKLFFRWFFVCCVLVCICVLNGSMCGG